MIKRRRILVQKEKGERTKHEHLPATHYIILEYIITFIQQLTVEGSDTFFLHSVYFPEPSLLSVQFFKQIARTQPLTKVYRVACHFGYRYTLNVQRICVCNWRQVAVILKCTK